MEDLIFQVPDFVKTASEADLNPAASDAVVVAGLRIDTKAGAWNAGAELRKRAAAGNAMNPLYASKINDACNLFGITDKDYQYRPLECEHIIVKSASHTAEFFVSDLDQMNESIQALLIKRASYPLGFCRDCANKLLDCAYGHDYNISRQDEVDLLRLAGTSHFNKEAAGVEIRKRADYARNRGEEDYAQRMYKLASIAEQIPEDSSAVLTTTVADAVDLFDQQFGLMNKLSSLGMERIEDALYMTAEEALQKSASDKVEIDDEHSIPKGRLMVEATRQQMAKWASMQGYTTSTEPEDIVDCVSAMPSSLRADFCQIFG